MTFTFKFDPVNNQKILDELEKRIDMKTAASEWQRYTGSISDPEIGELCLWSTFENGQRIYFTGILFESDTLIMLDRPGWPSIFPNISLYFARINRMEFENEQVYMTGDKVLILDEMDQES
jgi:hypothetical protein